MSKVEMKQKAIIQSLITKIEAGTAPWNPGYTEMRPRSAKRHNGENYRGINAALLPFFALEFEYTSPFWMTFKQAKNLGGQVRKGEKASPIFFYKNVSREDATHPSADANGEVNYKFMNVYNGFNANQIDGLPIEFNPAPVQLDEAADIKNAQDIMEKLRCVPAEIRMSDERPSFFNFIEDYIQLTNVDKMKSLSMQVSTLAHELIHFTGHESRLNRGLHNKMTRLEIAKEEIVAELGSFMLCADLGIRNDHADNHAAYLSSYLEILKASPKTLFKAASEAQSAIDYLKKYWTVEQTQKIAA